MKNVDQQHNYLFSIILILALAVSITGCKFDMFGGDPIDREQPDELATIEATAVGTVERTQSGKLFVTTNAGVNLQCESPSNETVEIGDVAQLMVIISGFMGKNEWMFAEVTFDKVVI